MTGAHLRREKMAVVKYNELRREAVQAEGVSKTIKANVIGPAQGWDGHTLRVFRIAPGGYTPHHQHDWEHVNYIMHGKGTLTVAGDTREVTEGDFAFVPPDTPHQFRNPYDEDFEFICIVPNRGA
jgi:quercetin dioxygenase-like cupin family protein